MCDIPGGLKTLHFSNRKQWWLFCTHRLAWGIQAPWPNWASAQNSHLHINNLTGAKSFHGAFWTSLRWKDCQSSSAGGGQPPGENTSAQQNLNLSAAFQGLCSHSVFVPSALSGEIFELLCLMTGYILQWKSQSFPECYFYIEHRNTKSFWLTPFH